MLDDRHNIEEIKEAEEVNSSLTGDAEEARNNTKGSVLSTVLFLALCVLAFVAGTAIMNFAMNSSKNKENVSETTSTLENETSTSAEIPSTTKKEETTTSKKEEETTAEKEKDSNKRFSSSYYLKPEDETTEENLPTDQSDYNNMYDDYPDNSDNSGSVPGGPPVVMPDSNEGEYVIPY